MIALLIFENVTLPVLCCLYSTSGVLMPAPAAAPAPRAAISAALVAQGQRTDKRPDADLDAAQRQRVLDELVTALREGYVFPDVATRMEESPRARHAARAYESVTSAQAFARQLTDDLQAISHDKHLRVRFDGVPNSTTAADTAPHGPRELDARLLNYGFEKVERLRGNVGYLDLRMFAAPERAAETASAAMALIANTDALIVDLRQNGGGSPEMVQYLCSYLFGPEPVHLNDLYFRPADETHQYWTLTHVPGRRYVDKPVYVLTSSFTFSGAEEFAYNLKTQKRATLVGETTGGGANPGGMQRLAAGFAVFVPSGRAINPITKTNWEGTGVEPDVRTSAEAALTRAHKLALEKLAAEAQGERKRALEDVLGDLAQGAAVPANASR